MNEGWARIFVGLAIGLLTIVTSCEMLVKRMKAQEKANPPPPVGARVEHVSGDVLHVYLSGGIGTGPDQPATPGLGIKTESQFKVPANAMCRIRSNTGALIELVPGSASRAFANTELVHEDGKTITWTLREGRIAIAATPDQTWSMEVAPTARDARTRTLAYGTGGLVSGEYNPSSDTFRLVVKDGTASVKESSISTEFATVTAGNVYTGAHGEYGKFGPQEPAPSEALAYLEALRKAQGEPAR